MYDVSPYEVLGVARTATLKEIRYAYLAYCRIMHPDKNTDASAVELVSIYEILIFLITAQRLHMNVKIN
jgi:curved DNA-binding protein CbpA